jgi:hypothetical protein
VRSGACHLALLGRMHGAEACSCARRLPRDASRLCSPNSRPAPGARRPAHAPCEGGCRSPQGGLRAVASCRPLPGRVRAASAGKVRRPVPFTPARVLAPPAGEGWPPKFGAHCDLVRLGGACRVGGSWLARGAWRALPIRAAAAMLAVWAGQAWRARSGAHCPLVRLREACRVSGSSRAHGACWPLPLSPAREVRFPLPFAPSAAGG